MGRAGDWVARCVGGGTDTASIGSPAACAIVAGLALHAGASACAARGPGAAARVGAVDHAPRRIQQPQTLAGVVEAASVDPVGSDVSHGRITGALKQVEAIGGKDAIQTNLDVVIVGQDPSGQIDVQRARVEELDPLVVGGGQCSGPGNLVDQDDMRWVGGERRGGRRGRGRRTRASCCGCCGRGRGRRAGCGGGCGRGRGGRAGCGGGCGRSLGGRWCRCVRWWEGCLGWGRRARVGGAWSIGREGCLRLGRDGSLLLLRQAAINEGERKGKHKPGDEGEPRRVSKTDDSGHRQTPFDPLVVSTIAKRRPMSTRNQEWGSAWGRLPRGSQRSR